MMMTVTMKANGHSPPGIHSDCFKVLDWKTLQGQDESRYPGQRRVIQHPYFAPTTWLLCRRSAITAPDATTMRLSYVQSLWYQPCVAWFLSCRALNFTCAVTALAYATGLFQHQAGSKHFCGLLEGSSFA